MSRIDQIYHMLKVQAEKVVSRQYFEQHYYGEMTKEQWRHFRNTFPECVMRKPGTNNFAINVTKWRESFGRETMDKKAS